MLTKTCQWTVAHANQTQLSQIPSRVHILHISTGWLHWEIRLRLGHSRLGVIRVHSFLLGQIKPSTDQADAFSPSHSTSSHNIPPGAVTQLWGLAVAGAVTGAAPPWVCFYFRAQKRLQRGGNYCRASQGRMCPPGTCDIGTGLCPWHLEESWHRWWLIIIRLANECCEFPGAGQEEGEKKLIKKNAQMFPCLEESVAAAGTKQCLLFWLFLSCL